MLGLKTKGEVALAGDEYEEEHGKADADGGDTKDEQGRADEESAAGQLCSLKQARTHTKQQTGMKLRTAKMVR